MNQTNFVACLVAGIIERFFWISFSRGDDTMNAVKMYLEMVA
jgi:hypothetical protein